MNATHYKMVHCLVFTCTLTMPNDGIQGGLYRCVDEIPVQVSESWTVEHEARIEAECKAAIRASFEGIGYTVESVEYKTSTNAIILN